MRWGWLLVLVASRGVAGADPTRKIDVVTDPPGATIYVGDLDAGEACKSTPCSVNVPAGKKTAVIARKDGYSEEFVTVDLRKGVPKTVTIKLTATTATLMCDDPGLAGGTILVDDVEKGKAPAHVPVETAGHHVVVTVKGRVVFDDYIKVDPNEEFIVKPNKSEPAPQPPKIVASTATSPTSPDDLGVTAEKPDDTATKPADDNAPHEPWFAATGVFEVGFRQFSYDHPQNLAATENEGGELLLGPSLQIWPTRLLGIDHLHGLSIYSKVLFSVNTKQVENAMGTQIGADTMWGNVEVDLQHRWNIGDAAAVEIGGGYVRDQLQYNAVSTQALAMVPDVIYQSMRLGVRGTLRLGPIEPYLQVEGRIPFSEGNLAARFIKADVTGGGASAGLAATFGPVVARLEASIVYYGWTLTSNTSGPMPMTADGATDVIEGISMFLGFAY